MPSLNWFGLLDFAGCAITESAFGFLGLGFSVFLRIRILVFLRSWIFVLVRRRLAEGGLAFHRYCTSKLHLHTVLRKDLKQYVRHLHIHVLSC